MTNRSYLSIAEKKGSWWALWRERTVWIKRLGPRRRSAKQTKISAAARHCRAFSLAEALVASAVTALAGAALVTTVASTVSSSRQAVRRAVAEGVAQLLMEELATARFPTSASTRPFDQNTRMDFDDLDDYDGYVDMPPTRRDGYPVGADGLLPMGYTFYWEDGPPTRLRSMVANAALLARLRRSVRVEPVQPSLDGWQPATAEAPFRRVTVTVEHVDVDGHAQTLYRATRIFAYVPAAYDVEFEYE